jgi:hypothetical protein
MAHGWPPNLVHVMAMELEHAPGWQGVVAAGMGDDLSLGISVMGLDDPASGTGLQQEHPGRRFLLLDSLGIVPKPLAGAPSLSRYHPA